MGWHGLGVSGLFDLAWVPDGPGQFRAATGPGLLKETRTPESEVDASSAI